jgi:hypothetical protein
MYKFNGIIDNRNPDKIKVKLYNKLTDKEVLVTAVTIINGSLSKLKLFQEKVIAKTFYRIKKLKLKYNYWELNHLENIKNGTKELLKQNYLVTPIGIIKNG